MYRNCIFCSKDLGTNEVIEEFPVGASLAFDAAKGRLWAVCTHCLRWNLAPIEERWEALESAERQFRNSRMRVQSENIGLAKMRDGTRLVRIGAALTGELAAWRYGAQLVRRRKRVVYGATAAGVLGTGALIAGVPLMLAAGSSFTLINLGLQGVTLGIRRRAEARVVAQLSPHESPTGHAVVLRRRHLIYSKLSHSDDGISVTVPAPPRDKPWYRHQPPASSPDGALLRFAGSAANTLASRLMVIRNGDGGAQKDVSAALTVLEKLGSAELLISRVLRHSPRVFTRLDAASDERALITPAKVLGTWNPGSALYRAPPQEVPRALDRVTALALEMALHDESERRAMEGELEILEDAWREAENIARIADALPGEPPED